MRLLLVSLFVALLVAPEATAGESVTCVTVTAEARPVGGAFNHIVGLDNGCEHAVRCTVATDVNPEAQKVTLAAGGKQELVTFRGSPARVFTPQVSCQKP